MRPVGVRRDDDLRGDDVGRKDFVFGVTGIGIIAVGLIVVAIIANALIRCARAPR